MPVATVPMKSGKLVLKAKAAPVPSAQTVNLAVTPKDTTPGKAIVQTGDKADVAKLAPEIKKLEKALEAEKANNVALQDRLVRMKSYEQEYLTREYPMGDLDSIWATCEDTPIDPSDWRLPHHNTFALLYPFDVTTDRAGNTTTTPRTDLPPVMCITMIPSSVLPREPGESVTDLITWRVRSFLAVWDASKFVYQKDDHGRIMRDANNEPIISGVRGVPGFIDKAFFGQILPEFVEETIEAAPEPVKEAAPVATTEAPKKIKLAK